MELRIDRIDHRLARRLPAVAPRAGARQRPASRRRARAGRCARQRRGSSRARTRRVELAARSQSGASALTRAPHPTHAAGAVSQGHVRRRPPRRRPRRARGDHRARARQRALRASGWRASALRTLDDLRALPLTTRADLQRAGAHGTRAVPLERCATTASRPARAAPRNSTWLTAERLRARRAGAARARIPTSSRPGRIILNRFPFMAAPGAPHPADRAAGRRRGDPRPATSTGTCRSRARSSWRSAPARTCSRACRSSRSSWARSRARAASTCAATSPLDTLFLGGSSLPPALQRRLARTWGARVIELYGSTETMLLGTSCAAGTLHLEPELAYCEVARPDDRAAGRRRGATGRLVVTTLGIEGSPLVRLDTGDVVRRLPPCAVRRPAARRSSCSAARRRSSTLGGRGAAHARAARRRGRGGRRARQRRLLRRRAARPRCWCGSRPRARRGGDPRRRCARRCGGVPVEIETVAPRRAARRRAARRAARTSTSRSC